MKVVAAPDFCAEIFLFRSKLDFLSKAARRCVIVWKHPGVSEHPQAKETIRQQGSNLMYDDIHREDKLECLLASSESDSEPDTLHQGVLEAALWYRTRQEIHKNRLRGEERAVNPRHR